MACSGVPPPTSAAAHELIETARLAYEQARGEAWAPRRFKALYRGEISPKVGPVARGYLSLFWDGTTLRWRTSAPIAGGAGAGSVRRDGGVEKDLPVPGRLTGSDLLAIILGVPDLPCCHGSATVIRGAVRLPLDGSGRTAVVDEEGRIESLELPDGMNASFEPGAGLPRQIKAASRQGQALLQLESYGPWPEDEGLPPGS